MKTAINLQTYFPLETEVLPNINSFLVSYGTDINMRVKGIHRLRPNFEIGSLVGRNKK